MNAYMKQIAGRDTTACLLSWMIYELCVNREHEEILLSELQKHASDGQVTYQNSYLFVYLEAFIMETLR